MQPKGFTGTRESRQVQAQLVRSDKPTKQEGSDDLTAVRLADSTLRSGEPTTWGSGQRKLNCSWETWAPFKGRIRPSMQREEPPTMETGLERIAVKARSEPKLRFTSLAHHVTRERVWENLCQIPKDSSPGWMDKLCRRRKRALENGLMKCCNPCTVRDIKRRTFDECISRNPGSRRNALWVFLA